MKTVKYQQVRIRLSEMGQSVRTSIELDKTYRWVKGIAVSLPDEKALAGTTLGLKIAQTDILDATHEVKLLATSISVAPNLRFFIFPEKIDGNGATAELTYTDGALYPLLADTNQDPNGVIDTLKTQSRLLINQSSYTQNPNGIVFPYDARIYLLLSNVE